MLRREFLGIAAALPGWLEAQAGGMFVCIHEITSNGFDFRTAMEGYAKAGIRAVEPVFPKLREFAQKESPAAARRLLGDLGLRAVSTSNQAGLAEPGAARQGNLEDLKWKLELAQAIGCDRMVANTVRGEYKKADYALAVDNLREAGEIAKGFGVTLMLEPLRGGLYATLPTALKLARETNHPNIRVMLEVFDFWAGPGKLEHLDALREGELYHVHFEDVPAEPAVEIQTSADRVFPGEGTAPLRAIVQALRRKKYAGALSLELFNPAIQSMNPYEAARKARATIEPLLV
jgi:2-keto-myo-inositol isomerase